MPGAAPGKLEIPQFYTGRPIFASQNQFIEPFDLKVTRFMVLEVVAALIVVAIGVVLAQKLTSGRLAKGRLWNALETVLLFIRDEVARPAIGTHDADRFLPYLWTIFFFVLTCNLLGMVPWLGSPTGALGVTGTLALMTFAAVVGAGSKQLGRGRASGRLKFRIWSCLSSWRSSSSPCCLPSRLWDC